MRFFKLAVLSAALALPSFATSRASGWCTQGAKVVVAPATVGGSPISRSFMQSYPSCTVTVYVTGSVTLANLFSNSSGAPLANPFSATNLGYWDFYAANGRYDVQISGGGLGAPYTFGDVGLFDQGDFIGQPPGSVQFNGGTNPATLAGSPNFTYNSSSQLLTVTGLTGTPSIYSAIGSIQSDGGFTTPNLTMNAFRAPGGGVNVGALATPQTTALNGGYIRVPPITYNPYDSPTPCMDQFGNIVQQPVLLPGDALGPHDSFLWTALSASMPANGSCGAPFNVDLNWGLFTNNYFFARGGIATDQPSYNSIQSLVGGVYGQSITAQNYMYMGAHAGPPPLVASQFFQQGSFYYDTNVNTMVLCGQNNCSTANIGAGSGWSQIGGGGGGGTAAGPINSVQFNNPLGQFSGSANFIYTETGGNSTLAIGTTTSTGGIASQGTSTAAFNAPLGGVTAKYLIGTTSASLLGDTATNAGPCIANVGRIYMDSASGLLMACQAPGGTPSAYVPLLGGSGSGPALPNGSVQYNSGPGAFAGTANLSWNNSAQTLIVTGTIGQAAIGAYTGYILSQGGFNVDPTYGPIAGNINAVQASTAGMTAQAFTATKYVQVGASAAAPTVLTGDTFAAGSLYYNSTSNCLEVMNNSLSFSCLTTGGATPPGGVVTEVQYNGGGTPAVFAGDGTFTWATASHTLTVGTLGGDSTSGAGILSNGTSVSALQAPFGGINGKYLIGTVSLSLTANTVANAGPCNSTTSRIYMDSTSGILMVCQAPGGVPSSYQALVGGGGGGSITSIVGTANQVIVAGGTGPTVTLSTPQNINATANVNFASVTTSATGGSSAFHGNGGTVDIFGSGDAAFAGVVNAKGLTVACSYQVNGSCIVDSSRNATLNTINAAGVIQSQASGTGLVPAFNISNGLGTTFTAYGDGDLNIRGALTVLASTGLGVLRDNTTQLIDANDAGHLSNYTATGTNSQVPAFNSTQAGSGAAFLTSNNKFIVDGLGDISAVGNLQLICASCVGQPTPVTNTQFTVQFGEVQANVAGLIQDHVSGYEMQLTGASNSVRLSSDHTHTLWTCFKDGGNAGECDISNGTGSGGLSAGKTIQLFGTSGNITSSGQLNVASVLANGNAGLSVSITTGGCTLTFNLGWLTSHSGC